MEYRIIDSKGDIRWVFEKGQVFFDEDGNLAYLDGAIFDITEKKQVEKLLQQREEHFRILFESSQDALMTLAPPSWKFTSANPYTIKLFNAKDETDFVSLGPWDTSPEKQPDGSLSSVKAKKMIEKAMKKGSNFFEWTHKTLDGKEFPATVLLTRVEIEKGKPFLQATVRDITDFKQFQESLKESEEKFRTISTSAQDGIIMIDDDGNVDYWNEASERMFGYKSDEIVGKNLHKILAPQRFHEAYNKGFNKFKDTGKGTAIGKTLELSALKKDGTEFSIDLSMSSVKIRGKWNAIAIIRDISERKKTEEMLKFLSSVVEQSSEGMSIADLQGNMVYVNNAWAQMHGYEKGEELIGRRLKIFHTSEQLKKQVEPFNQQVMKRGYAQGEVDHKRKDNTLFPTLMATTLLKDENGVPYAIASIVRDITKQKKAEEKIKAQNILLKKLDKIKSDFLNVTSHELRTPMSAIKGYTQMVLKQKLGEITKEQQNALEIILRNTNRLDALIQDILDISRLESGTMKFIPEKTDVEKMIKEAVDTIQPFADLKEIEIITDLEKLPELIIDQERVKQVIMNIVNNAIKFSPNGSIINIKTKRLQNDILFEIQDFGKGIPKNKQKKIFETFYQVDSGMNRKYGGAGLGLAISRGIILAHDGKIDVESIMGKGSTFKFTLPIKPVKNLEERFKEVNIFRMENNEKDTEKN